MVVGFKSLRAHSKPMDETTPATIASNDKTLAALCHVSLFLASLSFGAGFLIPLIVYLVKRHESAFVAAHAKEALNFHISLLLYVVCTIPFIIFTCGILIYPAILFYSGLALLAIICAIIGTVRAAEGSYYLYPVTIRLVS